MLAVVSERINFLFVETRRMRRGEKKQQGVPGREIVSMLVRMCGTKQPLIPLPLYIHVIPSGSSLRVITGDGR